MSPEAKDLLTKLLVPRVSARLTVQAMLEHPWMHLPLEGKNLAESHQKLRAIVVRRRLRGIFLAVLSTVRMRNALLPKPDPDVLKDLQE